MDKFFDSLNDYNTKYQSFTQATSNIQKTSTINQSPILFSLITPPTMQAQNQQSLQRLIKLSSVIESSCQYLTVIHRCITDEECLKRDSLQTLEEYLQEKKCKLNEQSLRQVLIQIPYFIFSCRRYNILPEIRKEDIRAQEAHMKPINEKKFSIVVYYKISDEKQLDPCQSIAIVKDIYDFIFSIYSQYIEHFKTQLTPLQVCSFQYIERFKKQVEYLLLSPEVYQNKEKEFFLCLEETSLFREYSSLLKIKNCSILDLIKSKEINFGKFKECKQKDVDLVIAYGNQKKKPKTDHDRIKQKEKEIEYNIVNLFKYLQRSESMMQESQKSQNPNTSKEQLDKMKIVYKHREKPINSFYQSVRKILSTLPEPPNEEPLQQKREQFPQMEFLIEYSSERNSICVRLIPNQINIHIENSDFLMYQSNILTFETVNVNIELVESVVEANFQKKTIKRLAFKGTSCLNSKEPPLEKILLLMDATMIASKICQPELNAMKVAYSGMSDHERLNLVANKINHYTRIYLKCAKKVYSE